MSLVAIALHYGVGLRMFRSIAPPYPSIIYYPPARYVHRGRLLPHLCWLSPFIEYPSDPCFTLGGHPASLLRLPVPSPEIEGKKEVFYRGGYP